MMDDKQMRNATKAVMAGMKILYAPQSRQILQQSVKGAATGDPQAMAQNVVGVVRMIFDKSGGTMPPGIIPIVTTMLMYEFASFVSEAAGKQIPEEIVREAVKIAMGMLKQVFAKEIAQGKQSGQAQPPAGQMPAAPQPAAPPAAGLINQGV